tara:strand:+ start:9609 stop:10505 length:897 start_codon:yes stop_codon:yes gene_type:complete
MRVFFTIFSIILISNTLYARGPLGIANIAKSVEALKSVDLSKSKPLVIAVIDTGIDKEHPDLKTHLWKNPGEMGIDKNGNDKSSNGIDDDENGYIDDLHGWNFIEGNHNLSDRHGHGSHVAGIVLGKSKPAYLQGTNLPIQIMVLKYFDPEMDFSKVVDYTTEAIRYAVANGADIINYSSGGDAYSFLERAAIQQAKDKGIYFITAAGNEGRNIDKRSYYPASYDLDNIISVSAVDEKQQKVKSSNYGSSVTTAAPGKDIYSTTIKGKYAKMTGTSQATAFVARKVAAFKLLVNHQDK